MACFTVLVRDEYSNILLSPSQWTVFFDASSSVLNVMYLCSIDLHLKGEVQVQEWSGMSRFYNGNRKQCTQQQCGLVETRH